MTYLKKKDWDALIDAHASKFKHADTLALVRGGHSSFTVNGEEYMLEASPEALERSGALTAQTGDQTWN